MTLMNPDNRRDKNNRTTKAIAAMPIVGTIIAASLLISGLSLVSSYHPALAQQNMTGVGNATDATTTGAATGGTQSEVMLHLEEVRTALQNNDIQGAMMHLDIAMNVLSGGTQGNMTSTTGSPNSTA